MRNITLLFIVLFILIEQQVKCNTIAKDTITEVESDWKFGLNAAFSNKYLWRGINYNDGLVLQPEAFVTYKDFSLGLWGNATLWDINGVQSNEVDIYIDYYHSFSFIDIECFLNYYNFINQECPNTAELFLGVFLPLGDFTVYTNGYVDVLEYAGGTYYEFGVNYKKELSDQFSLSGNLIGGVGSKKSNLAYFGIEKNAFNLVGGNVGVIYSLFEGFYIDANFYLNYIIDKELQEAADASTNAFEIKFRKEF